MEEKCKDSRTDGDDWCDFERRKSLKWQKKEKVQFLRTQPVYSFIVREVN